MNPYRMGCFYNSLESGSRSAQKLDLVVVIEDHLEVVKRRSLIVRLVYVCGLTGLSGRCCLSIIRVAYMWNPTVSRGSTHPCRLLRH